MTTPARTPYDSRRPPATVAQPAETSTGSNLNISTLLVAAAASVIAALVTSRLWQGGTLISTAMTPVIVALTKEFLDRPARKVTEVSSRAVRRSPGIRPETPSAERFDEPDGIVAQVHEPGPARAGGIPATPGQPSRYRVYGARRHRWRLAIVTGLLAFAVVAAVLTLPELVAGRSLFDNRSTTLFGGGHRHSSTVTTTTTTTATQTVTQTTPTQTVTVPTQTTPTTTTPAATTPTTTVPTQTTPAQTTPTTPGTSTTPGG